LPATNKGQKVVRAYRIDTKKNVKMKQNGNREITISDFDKSNNEITIIAIELNKKVME
jgi:hypothetical protein